MAIPQTEEIKRIKEITKRTVLRQGEHFRQAQRVNIPLAASLKKLETPAWPDRDVLRHRPNKLCKVPAAHAPRQTRMRDEMLFQETDRVRFL